MPDALLQLARETLPSDVVTGCSQCLEDLEQGRFERILTDPLVKLLLGHEENDQTRGVTIEKFPDWNDYVFERLGILLAKREAKDTDGDSESPAQRQHLFFFAAVAALQAFLQSNVTGPPLPFASSDVAFPESVLQHLPLEQRRRELVSSLSVDGEAAYRLMPNVELLCLADTILTCPPIKKNVKAYEWAKLRRDFTHQRTLSDNSATLQASIYESLGLLDELLRERSTRSGDDEVYACYLLERVSVHIHHGFDKNAREDLAAVSRSRQFEFALTGLLGKRTKYQEKDLSQLVVLARSREASMNGDANSRLATSTDLVANDPLTTYKPQNLDLNDETLLESISFTQRLRLNDEVVQESKLPPNLASLDPSNQPILHPLDSITLLAVASSITNTSPSDGLTREEALPYAVRVLDSGSSNWQVYTHALLVRSRIEGYRARTTERGLLQLQALVDQVIAETSGGAAASQEAASSTFLPRAKESESAPVSERLLYVHQICPPIRWELEAELAARWVSLGGLRSALEIYERLEMWPETALCLAATDREEKATKILRKQLYHATAIENEAAVDEDEEKWEGKERDPPPADASRLYCILGDMSRDSSMYEKAWDVSNGRYARAQRSLGRLFYAKNDFVNAAAAYSKSLKINPLNQSSWFALGCALLELTEFEKAAEAFSRTVQLDDTDAEAWSNLAAALLKQGTAAADTNGNGAVDGESATEDGEARPTPDPQQHKKDALKALKRAAALKRDSSRIWDNLLTVAASVDPPPYADIVAAQERVVSLRGPSEGERCVDATILEHLVRHVVATYPSTRGTNDSGDDTAGQSAHKGLPRLVIELMDKHITPLITSSARLWQIVATLALWRNQPSKALAAHEKAWRAVTSAQVDSSSRDQWNEAVNATLDLCDAYESLGPRERTEGLAAGAGEVVAKDWKFKARSAVRGIMGKGKGTWEDTPEFGKLKDKLDDLKGP